MSRTARIARALTIGYGYQAVVAATGLLLTPFLLSRLGVVDVGRWLVAGQVLGLIGLLDLGVTALLPREVARATGSGGGEPVAEVVRRAFWLVWLQTPFVALVGVAVWIGVSEANPDLGGPLAVVLAAFVIQFPLRLSGAILTGLQDLTFCAATTAAGWAISTAMSVGMVLAGWGLYSLAVGWATGQLLVCGTYWIRLRYRFRTACGFAWPGRGGLWVQLRASLWISLAQLAQLLVAGTDLLVIAWLIDPATAVVYSCTTKLASLLSNQCYAIGLTAQPALAQLRAGGDAVQFRSASRATGLALMMVSGAVAIGVTAVNGAFVAAWVGANQYAGPGVSALAVAAMLSRHLGFVWWNSAYVLGAERGIAFARIADGLITVAATALGAVSFGLIGAAMGSLAGAAIGFLPTGLKALADKLQISKWEIFGWVAGWIIRFHLAYVPVVIFSFTPLVRSPWYSGACALIGLALYGGLMYGIAATSPLRQYRDRVIAPIRNRFGRLAKRGCA